MAKRKYWLIKCKECNGSGRLKGSLTLDCPFCHKGKVMVKK